MKQVITNNISSNPASANALITAFNAHVSQLDKVINNISPVLKNEIVLIRGLPGSGKSTLARTMQDHVHFEADKFLEVNGVYIYDPSKVKDAHNWCIASAKNALSKGQNVVVSNTFVKLWELQKYVNLGYPFKIIELKGKWKNIHGVPQEKIENMAQRWEKLPNEWHSPSVQHIHRNRNSARTVTLAMNGGFE